ncbi:MAG: ABC transporter permease [Candidatus Margulisbacteria bacterium]|jgi:sulfonate transport system permease protein|nr:ABC transporter permease [Candidatus Margulisiibacteriota bacterium]
MTVRRAEKYEGFIVPAALLAVWELITRLGWVPHSLLVPPSQLALLIWELLISGELLENIRVSLIRVAIGFTAGSLLGLLTGLAMGLSAKAKRIIMPTFNAFRQISLFAWVPLLMLWFGIGEPMKYVFIALGSFPSMALNTMSGISTVPQAFLELARVYEYSRRATIFRVVIPAAFPAIFTGLRLSLGIAWMMVVGAELLASDVGVGFMMTWGRQLFQMDVVMVGVIIIGVIGVLLNLGVSILEKHILRWRMAGRV